MIRSLLTAAFALSFVLTASAQLGPPESRGTLKGDVVDAEGAPIQTAFVLVHRSTADDKHGYPDQRGSFEIDLTPGLYDIFIAADGFAPQCKVIEIKAFQLMSYHAILQVDAEHSGDLLVR